MSDIKKLLGGISLAGAIGGVPGALAAGGAILLGGILYTITPNK